MEEKRITRYEMLGSIERNCEDCNQPKLCTSLRDKLDDESILLCKDCMELRGLKSNK